MKKSVSILLALPAFLFSMLSVSCGGRTVPEHDHTWNEGTVTTEPTCHSEGVKTFKCTFEGCSQTKTENITMVPHTWDEGTITTQPTCHSTGIKTYTCINEGCNKTKEVVIEKLEHKFAEGEFVKIPDLLEGGEREDHCVNPGCDETKHVDVPAHADFEEQFGKFENNWTYGYLETFDPSALNINPHALTKSEGKYTHEGVEISKGNVYASGIAVLGYSLIQEEEKITVKANVSFNGVETSTRLVGYLVVADSHGNVISNNRIDEDAQNWAYESENHFAFNKGDFVYLVLYKAGECQAKGQLSFTLTPKCVHVWDKGEVTLEPTAYEEGERTYKCIVCNETKVEKIPTIEPEVKYFDFTGKLIGRFDPGVEGNTWVNNHTDAHVEVTKPGAEIYNGGMFVNTGLDLENGKTYSVTFDIWRKEDRPFKVMIQNKQWDAHVFDSFESFEGHVGSEFKVDNSSAGKLWISFEMGTAVNEVSIFNLLIEEVEYFDFTGKLRDRFDSPCAGETSIVNKTEAHVTVTNPGAEIYNGGMFVETGFELEADKSYTVSFNLAHETSGDYKVMLQNKQWDAVPFVTYENQEGHIVANIDVNDETKGFLWISIEMGTAVNELTLSELLIKESSYFNFNGRIIKRFDPGVEGNTWVNEGGIDAHVEVTKPGAEIYNGGMFINTGIKLEVGKTYNISFDLWHKEDDKEYKVMLQNKQWDAVPFATYGPNDEHVEETVEITTSEEAGVLWISFEMGTEINEVSISHLLVREAM